MVKRLEAARGNGTSMISLVIRTFRPLQNAFALAQSRVANYVTAPKDQVSRIAKMLAEEYVWNIPHRLFKCITF